MTRNAGYAVSPSWKVMLHDLGVDPGNVLRRAGLPQDLLSRPNEWLPSAEYFRLWESLIAESGDPLLPLRLGQSVRSEGFAPVLFAALCSPDLRTAADRISRHKALLGPMRLVLDEGPDGLGATFEWIEAALPPPASLAVAELIFLVAMARMATRHPIRPLSITTLDPPEPAAPYADYLGVPITRGPRHRVVVSRADAARPFLTANAGMWQAFEPELRRRLAELDDLASVAERVRAALLEGLPSGRSSMSQIAGALAMSTRTLQRRLRDEGTSFQRVLAATREALSRHYLTRTSMSATEIAFLLGFEEPNSFYRAFSAWTGTTPETLRQAPA